MTRFKSAFAVPSGFAVSSRVVVAAKAGKVAEVGPTKAATSSKRARPLTPAPADKAA